MLDKSHKTYTKQIYNNITILYCIIVLEVGLKSVRLEIKIWLVIILGREYYWFCNGII